MTGPSSARLAVFWLISLLALFGLLEGAVRGALRVPRVLQRIAGDDDASWRLRWVERRRGSVEIFYSFDRYDARLGWISKPGLRAFTAEDWLLTTNSRGLRGKEHTQTASPGVTRIAILGDSFTFGEEVADGETYAARLEELIPNTEVVNLGVHGYGHDQMLLLFREEGRALGPRVVVLGFVDIDVFRKDLRFRDYAKPWFDVRGDRLEVAGTPVPAPEVILGREPMRSRLADVASIAAARVARWTGSRERSARGLTARILDLMLEEIHLAGAKPVFFYLPVAGEIADPRERTDGERHFFEWCGGRVGLICGSARPAFAARLRAGVRLKEVGHWDAEGHRAAAEALRDLLREALP